MAALTETLSQALLAAQQTDAPLTRELPTPAAAFDAATRTYLAGQRVDMRALATELGVARTTLYRWTGGRDQLISDVIWNLTDRLIDTQWATTQRLTGSRRLLATFRTYVTTISRSRALQAFLQQETSFALRLLTARGSFQNRLVARVQQLLEEERSGGKFHPRARTPALAYAIVRLLEGFIYNDAINALEPRIDEAMEIVALMLD
jgi:AcrR family transcriptional regulator